MRAYAEVRNATTSRSWRCRVGGGLRRDQQRLQKTAKNTNRIPFAIETSLRARALEYRYITIRPVYSPVRALSRGEDDVVDGNAAEGERRMRVRRMATGTKIGKPKKLGDSTTKPRGRCRRSRVLTIFRGDALGARSRRAARDDRSFAPVAMPRSVDMSHSGRSLAGDPRGVPGRPRSRGAAGGRSFETRDAGGRIDGDPRRRLGWTRGRRSEAPRAGDVQDELHEEPHEPHDDEPHTGTQRRSCRTPCGRAWCTCSADGYESLAKSRTGLMAMSATSMARRVTLTALGG